MSPGIAGTAESVLNLHAVFGVRYTAYERLLPMKHADQEAEDYLARGFRDVDAAAVDKMARCLAYMDALPDFQQYKTTMLAMMKPQRGSIMADLGCGLGFDVRRLSTLVGPEGRAIGVDASRALIESARAASQAFPAAEFIQADIQNLPFPNSFLHSCKVDRTLQHVERPAAVLGEIFRAVRPGGTVVCAEPDWGTFSIEASSLGNIQHPIARQVAQLWSQDIRNPRIGRGLKELLEETGFVDLEVEEAVLSTPAFESSDIVFDITQTALLLAASSGSDEPMIWLAQLREASRPICCSVTLVINFAKRP
jgi:ubiquinone/menaquinone biosynthesis C-methylase UbiE